MLPREAREILARLELVMHGSSATWNSSGRSAERNPMPQGESMPPHLTYRRLMENNPARIDLYVQQAQEELARIQGTYVRPQPVGELPHLKNARMLKEGEGFSAALVAGKFDMTVSEVHRVRLAARDPERDPALGLPLAAELTDRDRVLVMADRGVSTREIARRIGKTHPTVVRWINQERNRAA